MMQVCAGELGHPKLLDWRLSDIWPILNVLQKLELSRDSFPQLHAQRKGDEVGGVGERKARRHLHRHTHTHTHTLSLSLSLSNLVQANNVFRHLVVDLVQQVLSKQQELFFFRGHAVRYFTRFRV